LQSGNLNFYLALIGGLLVAILFLTLLSRVAVHCDGRLQSHLFRRWHSSRNRRVPFLG